MANTEKKKRKLLERIQELEAEMNLQLRQKTSATPEISISEYLEKIGTLRKQLGAL